MNNEQQKAKELAELLTAFADGKQLQVKSGRVWYDYSLNAMDIFIKNFYDTMYEFRIKPETKRIALNQQDLIDRELSGKTMRVKHGIACMLIQDFNDEFVFFSDDEFSYEQLTSLEWIDDTPCYKEVDDE